MFLEWTVGLGQDPCLVNFGERLSRLPFHAGGFKYAAESGLGLG